MDSQQPTKASPATRRDWSTHALRRCVKTKTTKTMTTTRKNVASAATAVQVIATVAAPDVTHNVATHKVAADKVETVAVAVVGTAAVGVVPKHVVPKHVVPARVVPVDRGMADSPLGRRRRWDRSSAVRADSGRLRPRHSAAVPAVRKDRPRSRRSCAASNGSWTC